MSALQNYISKSKKFETEQHIADYKASQAAIASVTPAQFAGDGTWAQAKADAMREALESNQRGDAWIVR